MKKIANILCVVALTGCTQLDFLNSQPQAQPSNNGYYQHQEAYKPQAAAPQQPVFQAQAPVFVRQDNNEAINKVNNLSERVRRVERAMLRLDRRMQLIERNELSRMSSGVMSAPEASQPQGMFQPMSYGSDNQPAKLPTMQRPYTNQAPVSNRGGYRPVSYNDNQITSSLGVARNTNKVATRPSALSGMPSLADEQNSNNNDATRSVSIWTINYESGKVWPGRKELSSSREVVDALSGGKPVALYARGARPASKEFRERVRAVSKYLSKVAKIDSVPIASMPAKHMAHDTIEIIVTK